MVNDVPAGIVAALKDEAATQAHIAAIPAVNLLLFILYQHKPDRGCQGIASQAQT